MSQLVRMHVGRAVLLLRHTDQYKARWNSECHMWLALPSYRVHTRSLLSSITVHYARRTLDVTIWLNMHAMNFRSSWNTAWNYKRFCYEQIALHGQMSLLNTAERPTALDNRCHLQRNCCYTRTFRAGTWMTTAVQHSAVYNYIHTYIHSKLLFTHKKKVL